MLTPAFLVAGAMTYLYLQMKDLREQPHTAHERRTTDRPSLLVAKAPSEANYRSQMNGLQAVHQAPYKPHKTASVYDHPELPLRYMGKVRVADQAMAALDGDSLVAWQRKNADRKVPEHFNPRVVHYGVGSATNQRYRIHMQAIANPSHPPVPVTAEGLVAVY